MKAYPIMIIVSLFFHCIGYLTAYDVQFRNIDRKKIGLENRFSQIDRELLGKWRYFITFPRSKNRDEKPFVLTIDGEKWAIKCFVADIILFPVIIILIVEFASIQSMGIIYIVIFCICELPFALSIMWIRIVEERILNLSKSTNIADNELTKHIDRLLKKENSLFENDSHYDIQIIRQKRLFEIEDTYIVFFTDFKTGVVNKRIIAKRKTSKYYNGNETIFEEHE